MSWHLVREGEYNEYNIDLRRWAMRKPFGISGCVRVCNDEEFLAEAVESHLPYLDECVIVTQPSSDRTEEIAARLERKHSKVRVCPYPVKPVFILDERWRQMPENSIHSFVYLSNWALTQCRYSWIAKIEADVICLSSFGAIRERIEQDPDLIHYYGRVILNVAGKNRDQVSFENPRNGGWDEAVFNHHPLWRYVKRPKYEQIDFRVGEHTCMGWSALHVKRCKRDKIGWNNETYLPFTREGVREALEAFNAAHPYEGPDDPLGEECLFEVAKR